MTPPHSDSSEPSAGETFALVEAERLFLATLVELGVPFLIVGVGSAALQGARTLAALPALEAPLAVQKEAERGNA